MSYVEDWTAQRNGWKLVGMMGVDAGLCWVGDPCYIIHAKKIAASLGTNWREFCDTLSDPERVPYGCLQHKGYHFDMGHEGLGVVVNTGYGDGHYPVYAQIVDGRCMRVLADFDEAQDDEDDDLGLCSNCGAEPGDCNHDEEDA